VPNSDSFRQIVVFPEIYVLFKILLCSLCELPKESKTVNGVLQLGPKWPIARLGLLGGGLAKPDYCKRLSDFFLFFWCLCVIKGRQVQQSVNLAANGHKLRKGLSTVARGFAPSPLINSHAALCLR